MRYVVAFNRDRDSYQVPLALHQAGMLERLITDVYYPDNGFGHLLPGTARIRHRRADGLPSRMVSSQLLAAFPQLLLNTPLLRPRSGKVNVKAFNFIDRHLSQAALALAIRTSAHLFLYSRYAYHAFTAKAAAQMRKLLFLFHPHHALIQTILFDDFATHPECRWSVENEDDLVVDQRQEELDIELQLADAIIVASSFSARSIEHAGYPAKQITVTPYGISRTKFNFDESAKSSGSKCRFLFVGQGVQRKGLHHLLKAWKKLSLPNASLTIVASTLDPGIAALASDTVTILGKQPHDQLERLFNESHIFVMPSLVEGFGLVYLEALSTGCLCIGTENTGLPDLALPAAAALQAEAGNIDNLSEILQEAYRRHHRGEIAHAAIAASVADLTWSRFHEAIVRAASGG